MAGFVHDPYDTWRGIKNTVLELGCGGLAGSLGIFIGIPFDLIKVRMQSMPQKYTTMTNSIRLTLKEDGFVGFYRGMMAPIGSQVLINAVVFATESATIKFLEPHLQPGEVSQSRTNHFIAGMVAGGTQCIVLVPTDVVKCRMQLDSVQNQAFVKQKPPKVKGAGATGGGRPFSTWVRRFSGTVQVPGQGQGQQGPKQQYKGSLDCGVKILRAEGIGGLYNGLTVTAMRELPSIGSYFMVYKFLREQLDGTFGREWQTANTMVAGGLAGCSSWFICYPLDVIKTNIQVSGFVTPTATATSSGAGVEVYNNGIIRQATRLYQRYGVRGFFRGLGPTMMRAFPVNGVTFLVYEKLKRISGLYDAPS